MIESRKPRVGPLDSLQAVRRELGRVYRLTRQGQIPPADLSRYAYTLKIMADIIAGSDIERRIDALETAANTHPAPRPNGTTDRMERTYRYDVRRD